MTMNTDDIRMGMRQMRDAFMEFHSFRCGAARHIEGFDSYAAAGRFWQGWHEVMGALKEYYAESDAIADLIYEEALVNGEPWALEAHLDKTLHPPN